MFSIQTRFCTEVFFQAPTENDSVDFKQRTALKVNFLLQEVYKSDTTVPKENILNILKNLLSDAEKLKEMEKNKRKEERMLANTSQTLDLSLVLPEMIIKRPPNAEIPENPAKPKPTWEQTVNSKRQFIASCLRSQGAGNLAEIARYTRSSVKTVKRVLFDVNFKGEVDNYEYSNKKPVEQIAGLLSSISTIDRGFSNVTDLKRQFPSFSRSRILSELHRTGYRYRPLQRQRKVPKYDPPDSTNVCRVISHLAQALDDPRAEVLYTDEVKFPVFQTATHYWGHKDTQYQDRPIYNRRKDDEAKITVIALCSTTRMIAAQAFSKEVTGQDFLFFLTTVISRLPVGKKYTILADNAKWHHANVVGESPARKFLFYNVPRMFYLNLIENTFSFVRSAFRKRPYYRTLEEEARAILKIILDEDNDRKFKGIYRNHLRELIRHHGVHSRG